MSTAWGLRSTCKQNGWKINMFSVFSNVKVVSFKLVMIQWSYMIKFNKWYTPTWPAYVRLCFDIFPQQADFIKVQWIFFACFDFSHLKSKNQWWKVISLVIPFQYPNGTQNGDCGIFKKCDFFISVLFSLNSTFVLGQHSLA